MILIPVGGDKLDILKKLEDNIASVIIGKRDAIETVIVALLSGGHILVEDVPGLGKTYLAKSLAKSIEGKFKRIQFTPDLLPSDITGVSIYNQQKSIFEFQEGPIFTNILLADEINRATPRTQSSLLECMQEKQVTVDGITYPLPKLFIVIATQNPVEQQGVYNLPEAQIDRFLMQIKVGYPSHASEVKILEDQRESHPIESLKTITNINEIELLQENVKKIHIDPSLQNYIVDIVSLTRNNKDLLLGASPRASLALYRVCQAYAFLKGKNFVTPDIIKKFAFPVLRHRLILHPQAKLGGLTSDKIIQDILNNVNVPIKSYE